MMVPHTLTRLGSPPRMRGKAQELRESPFSTRITPAYAGKSRGSAGDGRNDRDHPPRMRGKVMEMLHPDLYAGKSDVSLPAGNVHEDHPRVCGEKKSKNSGFVPAQWITPAYAGKSIRARNFVATLRDHPRVCGEKLIWKARSTLQKGSPPRMRGKAAHRW